MRKQHDKQKIGFEFALQGQGQVQPLQNISCVTSLDNKIKFGIDFVNT